MKNKWQNLWDLGERVKLALDKSAVNEVLVRRNFVTGEVTFHPAYSLANEVIEQKAKERKERL